MVGPGVLAALLANKGAHVPAVALVPLLMVTFFSYYEDIRKEAKPLRELALTSAQDIDALQTGLAVGNTVGRGGSGDGDDERRGGGSVRGKYVHPALRMDERTMQMWVGQLRRMASALRDEERSRV